MEPLNKEKLLSEKPWLTIQELDEYEALVARHFSSNPSEEERERLSFLFDRIFSTVPKMDPGHNRATGALIPDELSWMEGMTAGEIRLIQFTMQTRTYLREKDVAGNAEARVLVKEADDLLKWLGVE